MAQVTSPEVRTREKGKQIIICFPKCQKNWLSSFAALSFPGWDQLVQSVHGIQGCFHAPVSSSLMLRVLLEHLSNYFQTLSEPFVFIWFSAVFLLHHLCNYFQPFSQPFVLIKTVCRDGEIIECFKRTREVGGIAQVRLVDRPTNTNTNSIYK